MSYGYIYVAQVAMGADYNQCLKAFKEAEAYNGPSIIIAYAPCINHGIKMPFNQAEQKKAVAAGYWNLFRFNPALAEEGKNPFSLDSKAPSADYIEFINGETRYSSLRRSFPEKADSSSTLLLKTQLLSITIFFALLSITLLRKTDLRQLLIFTRI